MKKATMMVLLFSFVATFLEFASGNEPVNQPVLQEGDRWEFRVTRKEGITSTSDVVEGDYEVAFLQGRLKVFQIADAQRVEVSIKATEDLKRMIAFGQEELQLLNFPLSIGKKWTAEYSHTQVGKPKPQQRWATFQVEKMEEIKVGGGTFQTLRIRGNGQTYRGTVTREWDYFYSPETKSIAKFYYDSGVGTKSGKIDIELIKFVPAGGLTFKKN